MNRKFFTILTLVLAFLAIGLVAVTLKEDNNETASLEGGEYTLVVEGFDWGAAATKVILPLEQKVNAQTLHDFTITSSKLSDCSEDNKAIKGKIDVVYAYQSDEKGNRMPTGQYCALVLSAGPNLSAGAPMQYFYNKKCRGNQWVDFQLTITQESSGKVWNREKTRLIPQIEKFDLTGKFEYDDKLTISYASFDPKTESKKTPLIIWLHGGGEGGFDTTIPLLANKAANYASPEIQNIFGGAYVLVPQCPGAWMHNEKGVSTWGQENDIYNGGLMAMIKSFVKKNPKIDMDRIYVGGCSNGGYMTLKLMLLYPDYFAAGFPSALAYKSEFLSDNQVEVIKDHNIWFIHSADDPVTVASETVIPVYKRLIDAGAKNVHLSLYDHVIDLTGLYGGKDYYYNGHFSWIYSHVNDCRLDYDGKPVTLDGQSVTIMEWMAAQTR